MPTTSIADIKIGKTRLFFGIHFNGSLLHEAFHSVFMT